MEEEMAQDDLAAQGPERRMMPRCALDDEATLLFVGRGNRVQCRIVELSLSGCRMCARERIPSGSRLRVEAAFKARGIAFRFGGTIEWSDGKNQVGVRFADLIPRRRDELIEVLRELEAEIAAKAEKAVADSQLAELQAQQDPAIQDANRNEPLPFLDRLWDAPIEPRPAAAPAVLPPLQAQTRLAFQGFRPVLETSLPAAPVPAPPKAAGSQPLSPRLPEAEPISQRPPRSNWRERRQQSRQAVDTSAVIFLINIGARLTGRILDLSAGGCRIRTDERFPVGIYTRVEAEFLLEGLPIRLGGVIQAVHDRDRRLVGIRFLDISARKRELLEQLIEEIEAMREEPDRGKPENQGATAFDALGSEKTDPVPVSS
jgi:c-di-GMP-binding flagellar brake protein YcgR